MHDLQSFLGVFLAYVLSYDLFTEEFKRCLLLPG